MNYEITFISREEIDDVKKAIESLGGKIIETLDLGRKKFAYPIKKEQAGLYSSYLFSLEGEKVNELSQKLELTSNVLRFLITQTQATTFKVSEKINKKEDYQENRTEEIKNKKSEEPKNREIIGEKISRNNAEETKTIIPESKEENVKVTETPKTQEKTKKIVAKPKKEVAPKVKKQKEVDVTEEERLQALEDKLSALLKD